MFGYYGIAAADELTEPRRSFAVRCAETAAVSASRVSAGRDHRVWSEFCLSSDQLCIALSGDPLFQVAGGAAWRRSPEPLEVIRRGYNAQGSQYLQLIGGRFALAIFDVRQQCVLLAVDRFGIERLCYSLLNGELIFGKSAEHVARFPGRGVRLDPSSILDYLFHHMIPAPATAFAGVQKLRAGHFVRFAAGRLSTSRYWPPPSSDSNRPGFDELRSSLHRSLRESLESDSPSSTSGSFLSGGLDSSTVAGLLAERQPRQAKTFTIGFGYADYDELDYSREANRHFGCIAHEYVVTGNDIADGIPLIARMFDEPFGNSSALPSYFCARFARESGVQHLLAGDGGDELFAGNSRYAEQAAYERYFCIPALTRSLVVEPILKHWPGWLDFRLLRRGRGYVEKASIPLPLRLEVWNLLNRLGTAEMLEDDFRAALGMHDPMKRMQELWDTLPATTCLEKMLQYDWQHTLADNDLRKVETTSRAAGIRVSYPMLHPAVVSMSMSIPADELMAGTELRSFYKSAMRGFLPAVVIDKKKHGFGLPFGLWLHDCPRLNELVRANLSALRLRGIIRSSFIDRLLALHGGSDAKYYGVLIWVLAMLEHWFQEHEVSL